MRAATIALSVSLAPTLAGACEIATYQDGYVVPPATLGADCSFNIPGPVTFYTDISGAAPVNIGGGRIGQRITTGFGCGADEDIWIVDCNSGEMIGIAGQPSGDMNNSRNADLLYTPTGALTLSPETTVADLAAVADSAGYRHWSDIIANLREVHQASRPDQSWLTQVNPACGCRILYPDSALATQ